MRPQLLLVVVLVACDSSGSTTPMPAPLVTDLQRDIVSTDLTLDVTALTGKARLHVAPDATASSASFDARGLTVTDVSDGKSPLQWQQQGGVLDVAQPAGASGDIVVDYSFTTHADFRGLSLDGSYTFLWPYFCGNLFPCHSAPSDGTTFTLAVTGVPDGQVAVFPTAIAAPAPSYQIALVKGPGYAKTVLGTTSAGTRVVFWAMPGDVADTTKGTAHLVAGFDHYEKTFGPYSFGDEVGSVAVHWGAGAYGGMEHHPLWHISQDSLADELTHLHEAAHGWFGDGVRIACWEDFVLSEGTVNYVSARALGVVDGPDAEQAAFDGYASELADALSSPGPKIARPPGCGVVDALKNFTVIPYDKGALFYRALAARIGADVLDGVLRDFYMAHVGGAAKMQDVLDLVKAKTGYDPTACAQAWLEQADAPTGMLATMCP